jgi:predicted transposase/invertase (TIGR01784 family)
MDTAIQKAQKRISFVRSSEEEFHAHQMREMALSDFTSGINNARREGIAIGEEWSKQRGRQLGKQEERMKYILKLSQKGMSADEMADLTDFPIEEVKNILSSLCHDA